MNFPNCSRFYRYDGCGELRSNGESCRIDDLYTSAVDRESRGLFGEVVGVGVMEGDETSGAGNVLLGNVGGGFGAGEDEEFAGWDVVPCRERKLEVL